MAVTITTGAGLNTWATGLELELYAGSPDNTVWSGTDYPGGLTAFEPRQTDGAKVAGLKLLTGTATILNYKAAAITLKLTGEATHIVSFMLGSPGTADHSTSGLGSGVRGVLSSTVTTGLNDTLTLTFPGGVSDNATADVPIWLVCA
tara:strand:+ start:854 stop:1294 length:441 start_codon:yes stop_codon:yes gene_type:complete